MGDSRPKVQRWARLKIIITRTLVWENRDDPSSREVEKTSFRMAWRLVGPRMYNTWWVKRWGKMSCGCTHNPITRRILLYLWGCEKHAPYPDWLNEETNEPTGSTPDC